MQAAWLSECMCGAQERQVRTYFWLERAGNRGKMPHRRGEPEEEDEPPDDDDEEEEEKEEEEKEEEEDDDDDDGDDDHRDDDDVNKVSAR